MGTPVRSTASDVVMIADLIAAGDQSGCRLLRRAAMPLRCGVDMDVPDSTKKERSAPSANSVCVSLGAQAARMFMPGPVMSGFRMPGLALLGPRDEKKVTVGDGYEPMMVPLKRMLAVALAVEFTYAEILLTCDAGRTCASAKVVYPSAALFITIMPTPPYADTVWPASMRPLRPLLSQSTTLPVTSVSRSTLQSRLVSEPSAPGNTSESGCSAELFPGWNRDSPWNSWPSPSLTVVRIARSMVPAATVSIHGAPLPTVPGSGPALPAAQLTRMPRSMALNAEMAMGS
ncbi:hypothetical protein EJB05_23657, partial [Eragrostis curvula]